MNRVLTYYDPFSVTNETRVEKKKDKIYIEGLSVVAALGLPNCKQLSVQNDHYIPAELFELGLVDEFKDLCGLSHNTFNFIYTDLKEILKEKHSISKCDFYDSKIRRLVNFDKLSLESDIKTAENSYENSIQQKALDHASYCWLGALKTNVETKVITITKNIPELDDLVTHIGNKVITNNNNIPTYTKEDSIISLYKHNIVNLLKSYDTFEEDLHDGDKEDPKEKNHVSINANIIKSLLGDLGLSKDKADPASNVKLSQSFIKEESFKPSVTIAHFMDEKFCIDMVASAILYENNENLLSYDELNLNNIDNNLRIIDPDRTKIKQGILYDLLNGNKKLDEFTKELSLNKTTENTIDFNSYMAYMEEQNKVNDPILYQDYNNNATNTMNKEQGYLISKYVGQRKKKLGKAFSLIHYCFELSTSLRILQDLKRYALLTPKIITTRNSYDNYIFPNLFIVNEHLFEEYKHLIENSYKMYEKIIKKGGSYATAQYSNILGVRCNYLMNMNFRQLDSMLTQKTKPEGHFEYREVCQGIYNIIKLVHPNLAKLVKIDLNDYKIPLVSTKKKALVKEEPRA